MRVASEGILTRLIGAAPAAILRAGCVALFVCVSGCGGGSDGASPPTSMPTPARTPAPGSTQPPPTPAQLVVGTAQSIDSGASGNPTSLRVARTANGDGFAVWLANDERMDFNVPARNLWANRYSAATAAWGSPINIAASSTEFEECDLAVDASGNSVVVWNEISDPLERDSGMVMSARFDTGAGAWAGC